MKKSNQLSNHFNNSIIQIKISNNNVFQIKINNNRIIQIQIIIMMLKKKKDPLHRIQFKICIKQHLLILAAPNNIYH